MSTALLEVEGIDTYYGPSHVLQGVSLAVARGSVVGLLGRNGAGKSTVLKSIMGIVPAASGAVRVDGADVTRRRPHQIARLGIAYVPEDRGVFPSLSVAEQLTLGRPGAGASPAWTLADVYELFPVLRERSTHGGAALSGGEQQMLSIARALMLSPKLLILDEPAEGLAPVVIREIAAALERLKAAGLTILLVEQNYPFARRLSDTLYVLGKGRIRWQGTPAALEEDPALKRTWIGV